MYINSASNKYFCSETSLYIGKHVKYKHIYGVDSWIAKHSAIIKKDYF